MNTNFEGALALLREDKKRLREIIAMKDEVIRAQANEILILRNQIGDNQGTLRVGD